MAKLNVGDIGYVLGRCPVLVISYPVKSSQMVVYLRNTQGHQMGGSPNNHVPIKIGDVVRRKNVIGWPQHHKYTITDAEELLADQYREQFINA